ncbi:hypothetical protein OG604_34375 [Streptomyces sp. NBC_01231]|nr:hypothetical protein OG604_34375 [Streptomyces sp. NBC_01231]
MRRARLRRLAGNPGLSKIGGSRCSAPGKSWPGGSPTDPAVRGPGFAFATALDVPEGAAPPTQALRLLGRAPERWPTVV